MMEISSLKSMFDYHSTCKGASLCATIYYTYIPSDIDDEFKPVVIIEHSLSLHHHNRPSFVIPTTTSTTPPIKQISLSIMFKICYNQLNKGDASDTAAGGAHSCTVFVGFMMSLDEECEEEDDSPVV